MKILATAAAGQLVLFLRYERRMTQTGGPGIIAFELAGPKRSSAILERWGESGRAAARSSLRLDFLFPATYAPLQALACTATTRALADGGHHRLAGVGPLLAWAQLAAAGFDYIENTALLVALNNNGRGAQIARTAALTKFALLTPGWTYLAAGASIQRRSSG